MSREYHVAVTGCDYAAGTAEAPFLTISRAAREAVAGDKVIVHAGVYREWVKPQNPGMSDTRRIVYEAAPGEKVVIKGSEQITCWENIEGTVWRAVLPNSFFGDYNPYREPLDGDWFVKPEDDSVHPGDVYLNGVSFFEAKTLEEVKHPEKRIKGYNPPWSHREELILHPEQTIYQWYAQADRENTTIYANFQGADPNKELTEINVRKCCFYPDKPGVDYITVRGFEIAQAACPWTPPTADQPGMVGVHWSKGWIIEDNILHDAKCSAISIGKEASTGHNLCARYQQKPGYQCQMESVFQALRIGWSKEKIGSHIIRNNVIYDCGQNGIVGHMGGVFSEIYHNHIYNIAKKQEFFGYEIAGIKLHAAIDVIIRDNYIHDCTLGTWLDWQAQGTRITGNVYNNNDRDFMIEVTHGPCLIDNNVFGSEYNFDNVAQGSAFVHNLCCGSMRRVKVLDRSTPYHYPHTTEVAAATVVYSGDDRLCNNLFVGGAEALEEQSCVGTDGYNDCTASYEEYLEKIIAGGRQDLEKFVLVEQPAYINGNVYVNGAKAFDREKNNCILPEFDPQVKLSEEGGAVYLELNAAAEMLTMNAGLVSTESLGHTRITDACYENPDGSPLRIDVDKNGVSRGESPVAGPVQTLQTGANKVKIWG